MSELTTPNPENNLTALAYRAPEVADMFTTLEAFNASWKIAGALCEMSMLAPHFRGQENRSNCMMLLNIAHSYRHMGIGPFTVAQNLVPVNGKYGWLGQFVAALVNVSKRFAEDLRYEFDGEGDQYGCTAVSKRKDGSDIRGTKITWEMVKAEGWYSKSGSKWKTMPQQMFLYRAAAFFGRAYTPDLLMGFGTADELEDMRDVTPQAPSKGDTLTAMLMGASRPETITAANPTTNVHTAFQELKDELVDAGFSQQGGAEVKEALDNIGAILDTAKPFSQEDSIWEDMKLAEAERVAEEKRNG